MLTHPNKRNIEKTINIKGSRTQHQFIITNLKNIQIKANKKISTTHNKKGKYIYFAKNS